MAIGRPEAGLCGIFPPDGAELLRYLMAGNSPSRAAAWYQSTYGEAVAMDQFLVILDELGFLKATGASAARSRPARGWFRRAAMSCSSRRS